MGATIPPENLPASCAGDRVALSPVAAAIYRENLPDPLLNIKTVFPRYVDSHVKDKTVGETVLSLTWESL